MPKQLSEEHSELFHYTGAAGLKGIIESRTLWATHYKFLNDATEIRHFGERLPSILLPTVRESLLELVKQIPENQQLIDQDGGVENATQDIATGFVSSMYSTLLNEADPFAEPFITSFCTTIDPDVRKHGLLSQWRGYGLDGGYAIVFKTSDIESSIKEESNNWDYSLLFAGDAVYSSDSDEKFAEEIGDQIDTLKSCVRNFIETNDPKTLEDTHLSLLFAACRYKNWGFKEEKEVRIVAIPNGNEVLRIAQQHHVTLRDKTRNSFVRSGAPVPFIRLFNTNLSPEIGYLPIERIIIGPHPEKDKRKRSVEILLRQNGIDAEVFASEIPYIGR